MAFFLSPFGNSQAFDANGDPLVGGSWRTFLAGTTTARTTYTSNTGAVQQGTTMTLDALGLPVNGPVWMEGGIPLKFRLFNAAGVVVDEWDNISGIGDTSIAQDEWVLCGAAPTYISATSFSVAGDQTSTFQIKRKLKSTNTGGTVYSTITVSSFGAGVTTVTVTNSSGVIDFGLSAVSYGLLASINPSVPDLYALKGAIAASGLISMAYGQCRLTLSAGSLKLSPFNGNLITVNGVTCTIPDAGVTLAATGLLATTRYYIYAVATEGVITSLEASTTGHSTDTTAGNKGVEIKTGDSTRSLVGMAYVKTAATFADTPAQRFVLSWFNRKSINGSVPFTSSPSGSSATYAELSSSFRLEFAVWSGDVVDINFYGNLVGNVVNSYIAASFGIDSTTVAEDAYGLMALQAANAGTGPNPRLIKSGLSEGYHYATLLCHNAGGGNAYSCTGGATAGARSVISGIYQG